MPRAPDLSGVALDGRYELHESIGEGAFGRVYRGRDRRLRRWVAVKVIKPWWAEEAEWVARFEREAQVMASVSDPGIVQIFDIGHVPEGLFYVAELIDGESLAERLTRGPLPAEEAALIAETVARALGRAHAQGVVHRDVKPANLLLGADGRVRIGDFGIARLADGSGASGATAGATVAGTPRYLAPEQARGEPVGPATDVYGLAVVLYEMLAGRPPFTGETAVELALAHVEAAPPPLPGAVPAPLTRVVMAALAKEPSRRPRDGASFALALSQAVSDREVPGTPNRASTEDLPPCRGESPRPGQPTLVSPGPLPRRDFRPGRRRERRAAFAVVAALLVVMGLAALLLRTGTATVPRLAGLGRARIDGTLRQAGLRAGFTLRYSDAPRGTAVAQRPAPGRRVNSGSLVSVVLSSGLAPVTVPRVTGRPLAIATAMLESVKLTAATSTVPAPGVRPGTVTGQNPNAGSQRPPGAAVLLSVAEVPRFRILTRLSGTGAARSVPFRILGHGWRIVYSMHYDGTCTFIFFCSGPTATVTDPATGARIEEFDLSTGAANTRPVAAPPGVYEMSVQPGGDNASYSLLIEDRY